MSRFLLLLGASAVGKSTIIDELLKREPRFVYIAPFTTRPLRPGERSKVFVTEQTMDTLVSTGELLAVNQLFGGIRYGTPRAPIVDAFKAGNFPVLDWPIDRIGVMQQAFPGQLYVVYVSPPSLAVLRERLCRDDRDLDGTRFRSAQEELERFWSGHYDAQCDLKVVSVEDQFAAAAAIIHQGYLS